MALAVDSINNFVSKNLPLLAKMNDIQDTMNRISSRYQQMQNYEAHKDKLEMSTLISFAEWTVSPNAHSVHHLMDRLHLILLGNGNGNGREEKQHVNSTTTSPSSSSNNLLSQLADNYKVTHKCKFQRIMYDTFCQTSSWRSDESFRLVERVTHIYIICMCSLVWLVVLN